MAINELGDDSAVSSTIDLSAEPSSISESLDLARALLSRVEIPAGCERDLEDLDASPNGRSWAELTWRGLRALHVYAESNFDGNFKRWCQESGHYWAWSANDKKLAMTESEQVRNNQRLAAQRVFPVSNVVESSGRVLMLAHLKIAEGGGPMAPRVYFLDDTRGSTGNVHIGFVGPHRYVENTKTN